MMGLRVAELFAGVGGFRAGLKEPAFTNVWSNQWEPGERAQWASKCYVANFGPAGHTNQDITTIETVDIPDHDLLVGGFPCQDYSVATTKAEGIHGKKGVLWWEIDRIITGKKPDYVLLENVDRILRSPRSQRGRDFGIMLRCFSDAGYRVEWRAVNAAHYGFPQKRRRTFIFAARRTTPWGRFMVRHASAERYLTEMSLFSRAFGVVRRNAIGQRRTEPHVVLPGALQSISDSFEFHFLSAGVMKSDQVWTEKPVPIEQAEVPLSSVLRADVPREYFVSGRDLKEWKYLKKAKAAKRTTSDGFSYSYKEGSIPFPDPINRPARTILTQEGGTAPSRFSHLIRDPVRNRYRRLTPEEVEQLNGFKEGWTRDLPPRRRYFCMGNALVVGLVETIGRVLIETLHNPEHGLPVGASSATLAARDGRPSSTGH